MLTTFPFWLLFFNVISVSSATRSRLRRLKRLDNYIIMLEPQLNLAHAILYMNVCFSTFLSGAPNSVCHFSWLSIDMIVVKHKNSFMWVGAWGTINRIKWHIIFFWKALILQMGWQLKFMAWSSPAEHLQI